MKQAFAKMFHTTPDDLDMHIIYDVSHNIAKVEEHMIDGKQKTLLVHRKGSTRAFPPHHPLIPVDYQVCWPLNFNIRKDLSIETEVLKSSDDVEIEKLNF